MATTHVEGEPNALRQQYWSVLYFVQGLRQALPDFSVDGQLETTEPEHALGDTHEPFDTVTPIGLSMAST